jgi:hypothetical protein
MTHDTPPKCPECQSTRIARVVYGLPHFTPELEDELEEQVVVLGGCVIFDESSRWQCVNCGHRWGHAARETELEEGAKNDS